MQRHNEGHREVLYRVSVREKGKKIPAPRIRFDRGFPVRLRALGKKKEHADVWAPVISEPRKRREEGRAAGLERSGTGWGSWVGRCCWFAGPKPRVGRGGRKAGGGSLPFFFFFFFSVFFFPLLLCFLKSFWKEILNPFGDKQNT